MLPPSTEHPTTPTTDNKNGFPHRSSCGHWDGFDRLPNRTFPGTISRWPASAVHLADPGRTPHRIAPPEQTPGKAVDVVAGGNYEDILIMVIQPSQKRSKQPGRHPGIPSSICSRQSFLDFIQEGSPQLPSFFACEPVPLHHIQCQHPFTRFVCTGENVKCQSGYAISSLGQPDQYLLIITRWPPAKRSPDRRSLPDRRPRSARPSPRTCEP